MRGGGRLVLGSLCVLPWPSELQMQLPQYGTLQQTTRYISILNIYIRYGLFSFSHTWFLVCHINIQKKLYAICDDSCPPVDDEHYTTAEHGSKQRHPHVVILECRSPAWVNRKAFLLYDFGLHK